MITLDHIYILIGVFFAIVAVLSLFDRANGKRLGNAAFWGEVTAVLGILAVVGAGLVWGPAAVTLALSDRIGAAIFLAVLGAVVVGNVDVVIRPPDAALGQMGDFVRDMHTKSGLLEELADGMSLGDAQDAVLAYVREHCPAGSRPPLAGNTVATDRSFLERDMSDLTDFLHYRIVDVSSIKELARRWYPKAYQNAPTKHGGHRALADIRESIEELRYYREAVFVPPPGPDAPALKEISERHGGALAPDPGTDSVSTV